MKAYLHRDGNHFDFTWNIDSSVGRGGQNSQRADILYIQWYYKLAVNQAETPPDRKALYNAVQLSGSCTGRDDDPLVRAILEHQRAIKHPQVDGRVSVATGGGKVGESAFFVLRLGARIARMYPELWPRLDKIPSCPPEVAAASRLAIPQF